MPFKRQARKDIGKMVRKGKKATWNVRSVASKVGSVIKTVGMLKGLINAEKKYILNPTVSSVPIGQTNSNADALYIQDITPLIPIGAGQSERTGSSVKLTSFRFRCQIQAMKELLSRQKVVIEIYRSTGPSQTVAGTGGATVSQQLYNADSISGLYDYFATRNSDFYPNFKLIKRFNASVYPAQLDPTTTNPDLQPRMVDIISNVKYGHHLRYNYNSTDVAAGQLFMVVRCDTGNTGGSPSSAVPNIVNIQPNSGSFMSCNFFWHYIDN